MKRPERDDLMNELKIGCVGSEHMTLNFSPSKHHTGFGTKMSVMPQLQHAHHTSGNYC